jgi:hypothetical protein
MSKSTKVSSARKLIQLRSSADASKSTGAAVHVYGNKVRCDTETRGFPTPKNLSPLELVLDASEGFIPLWKQDTTLRWKFRDASFNSYENPAALKAEVRKLFAESLLAWGDVAPVTFTEQRDVWDFEIIMSPTESCDVNGCVLARAFFPDAGRHNLTIWPTMFTQERAEPGGNTLSRSRPRLWPSSFLCADQRDQIAQRSLWKAKRLHHYELWQQEQVD